MAKEAEKRGLPPQLPVMAALVESNLTNVNFGDADSLGYFQMRVSIWNQGDYAGYADDPAEADRLVPRHRPKRVKEQRIARGQSITDPDQFGEWIADVERPAEQYRGRYQLKLDEANGLLKHAPADTRRRPPPRRSRRSRGGAGGARGADRPGPVRPGRHGRRAGRRGAGAAEERERRARRRRRGRHQGGPDRPAHRGGADEAQRGPQDRRLVHVLGPPALDDRRLGLEPHVRARPGHRVDRRRDRQPGQRARARGRVGAVAVRLEHPPDEIGSPFAISGPGYFTDAAHSNHIHVGFKQEIAPGLQAARRSCPRAPSRRRRPWCAAAAAGRRRSRPSSPRVAASAPPPDPKRASGLFAAAEPAQGRRARRRGQAAAGDSKLFLQAVQAQQPGRSPPPPRRPPAAAPAAVDLSGVAAGYPGDDAPKEQIAAWMAKEAEKRGLPPQLPVMAALVESNLSNVNYGDADSLGYFQMRVSIWNQGEYAGYADDPQKQIDWFLDPPKRVKEQRVSRGQSITDPDQFGEWIADVERPAEQYRGRYQLKLDEAHEPAQGRTRTDPGPHPTPPADGRRRPTPALEPAPPAMARGAGPKALAALEEAKKYTGTPYKWGGSTPQTGFDCSGLVQWAYAQAGIQIPRVTDAQIAAPNGTPVRRSELLPGDLVFFRDASGYVHHVGISMGGDKFLHAPHTGDVVKVVEPRRAVLQGPVHRRPALRRRRRRAAPRGPGGARRRAGGRPGRGRRRTGGGRARRRRGAPAEQRPVQGDQRPGGAQPQGGRGRRPGAGERGRRGGPAAAGERADAGLRAVLQGDHGRAGREGEGRRRGGRGAASAAAAPGRAGARAGRARRRRRRRPAPRRRPAIPAGPPPDLAGVPADYPGDDAGQEELAKWLAKRAEKAGLPPELPVMAALVESGVRNLNFGDADSVGFFQMRVGIWNKGEYAGYPENPGLQAKWFIDTALAVKRQRIAAGDAGFGKDPRKWGEWIADVERPAEQYRGRYQLRLAEARRLLR